MIVQEENVRNLPKKNQSKVLFTTVFAPRFTQTKLTVKLLSKNDHDNLNDDDAPPNQNNASWFAYSVTSA